MSFFIPESKDFPEKYNVYVDVKRNKYIQTVKNDKEITQIK